MGARLSAHFTMAEAVRSDTAAVRGIANTPTERDLPRLYRMAEFMEVVRHFLGDRPIRVTSWYRSPRLNKAVGGSKTSAHMIGLAVDFRVEGLSNEEVVELLADSPLEFDQLIEERTRDGAAWVHIGLSEGSPLRRQVLVARGDQLGGPMTYRRIAEG